MPVATSAGTFPPYYYLAVGGIAAIMGGAADPAFYRIAAVALVAVTLALALVRLRRWPHESSALLLAAALPPSAWFLIGVTNTNSLEIALALLSWVILAEVLREHRPFAPVHLTWCAAPMALSIAIRPVSMLGLAPIVAIGAITAPPRLRRELRSLRSVSYGLAPIIGALAATLAWYTWSPAPESDQRTALAIGAREAAIRSLQGVRATIREATGSLGWLEFAAPRGAVLVWWTTAGMAAVASLASMNKSRRYVAAFAAWAALLVFVPVLFETLTVRRFGLIWQGRYSIGSLLGGVAVGAVAGVPERFGRFVQRLVVVSATAACVTLWAVARRYAVGIDGSWWMTRGADPASAERGWIALSLAVASLAALTMWWRTNAPIGRHTSVPWDGPRCE